MLTRDINIAGQHRREAHDVALMLVDQDKIRDTHAFALAALVHLRNSVMSYIVTKKPFDVVNGCSPG